MRSSSFSSRPICKTATLTRSICAQCRSLLSMGWWKYCLFTPVDVCNTTFWPLIVTASFATMEEQQRTIAGYFLPVMPVVLRALEVLRWVWDSQGMTFGLSGLARVIQLHETSYCFG
ncbi:hypothetical protein BDW72DRAFT_184483 [Aspergillus terricola var. indicus]